MAAATTTVAIPFLRRLVASRAVMATIAALSRHHLAGMGDAADDEGVLAGDWTPSLYGDAPHCQLDVHYAPPYERRYALRRLILKRCSFC